MYSNALTVSRRLIVQISNPNPCILPTTSMDYVVVLKGYLLCSMISMYRMGGPLLLVAKGSSSLIFMRQLTPKVMAIPCQKDPRKRHSIGSQHPAKQPCMRQAHWLPAILLLASSSRFLAQNCTEFISPQGNPLSITVTFQKELSHGQLLLVCNSML